MLNQVYLPILIALVLLVATSRADQNSCPCYSPLAPCEPNCDELTQNPEIKTYENLTTPFAFLGDTYTTINVGENGIISFGDEAYNRRKGSSCNRLPVRSTQVPFIAVYNHNIDPSCEGGSVKIRLTEDEDQLDTLNRIINGNCPHATNIGQPGNTCEKQRKFDGKLALVATWDNSSTDCGNDNVNTFQAVLTTDGERSYLFKHYTRLDSSGGLIGYQGAYGKPAYVDALSCGDTTTDLIASALCHSDDTCEGEWGCDTCKGDSLDDCEKDEDFKQISLTGSVNQGMICMIKYEKSKKGDLKVEKKKRGNSDECHEGACDLDALAAKEECIECSHPRCET